MATEIQPALVADPHPRTEADDPTASVAKKYPVERAPTRKWVPQPALDGSIDWEFLSQILEINYRNYRHGNPEDPIDNLIYVMLTRKTPILIGARIFSRLKKDYSEWDIIIEAGPEALKKTLQGSGLESTKARDIVSVLEVLKNRIGSISLESLKNKKKWPDKKCLDFLASLPGVGTKTARCVMMYTLEREVFPADAHCIRVLTRMGLIPVYDDHRKAQEHLADIIPGNVAYKLHINLVSHGKNVCLAANPDCERCDIRKFCEYYRKKVRIETNRDGPTCIDLFSGAGGTSLGLTAAGYRILAAIDNDKWACQTYLLNYPEVPPERVICDDIHNVDGARLGESARDETVDLVIGGPPCQGFSMIGARVRGLNEQKRFIDDDRNELYREFVRLVQELRPRIVVMENVPGLFSFRGGLYRDQIKEDLNHDYIVEATTVNSRDFGVPQRRIRVIFVGASREAFSVTAKEITEGIITELKKHRDPGPDLHDGVADLPPLEQDDGDEVTSFPENARPISAYTESMSADAGPILFNHVSRPLNIRDQELYALLKPGETGNDAVEKHNRRDLMVYRTDVFRDKYRRLDYDRVAPTVVAHLCKDGHMFIHPDSDQSRSITVREAARIQSFPDDFIFYAPRSYQYRHVGNAVPPLLAKKLGVIIRDVVRNAGFDW